MSKAKQVIQAKISLFETEPVVWRRILVSEDFNLFAFHVAIQDAMGWEDYHMHLFTVEGPEGQISIGPQGEDTPDDDEDEQEYTVGELFNAGHRKFLYVYDFGDNWVHLIELEASIPKTAKKQYPKLVDAENRCPPEDVGGTYGFHEYIEVLADKDHERYEEMKEWRGGRFNVTKANPRKNFRRWEDVFYNQTIGPYM